MTKVNDIGSFVLPICRYYDDQNEYVVIHAPDDKNKCDKKSYVPPHKLRLQDSLGIPFTLEMTDASCQEENILRFVEKLKNQNFDISLTPKDIWHVDGRFKLNLFLVDKL